MREIRVTWFVEGEKGGEITRVTWSVRVIKGGKMQRKYYLMYRILCVLRKGRANLCTDNFNLQERKVHNFCL